MAAQGSASGGKPGSDPATSGLEGVVVARTELSDVKGLEGKLTIRGYNIEEVAGHASFEEMAHLLWHGALPSASELAQLRQRLAAQRALPEEARHAVELGARRMG